MPEYAFECQGCQRSFALVLRISERATAAVRCPHCGSERVEAVMQQFVAKTAKKS